MDALLTHPSKLTLTVKLPFSVRPGKRVYATWNWADGLRDREAGVKQTNAVVAKLEAAGVVYDNFYPWWSVKHATATKRNQLRWILEFLLEGDREETLFVWDVTDRSEDNLDGSSKAIWHFCMGMNIPCVIYDAKKGERLINEASGQQQHAALNFLAGSCVGKVFNHGCVTVIADADTDFGVIAREIFTLKPMTYGPPRVDIPHTAKRAYITCQWDKKPMDLIGDIEALGVTPYPWWEANTHKGAPHLLQLSWIRDFLFNPQCVAFIMDVTDMKRADGSSKFLWQMMVGIVARKFQRGEPRPLIIAVDRKLDTRMPPRGSEISMAPCMSFMAGHTVNQEVCGVTTHLVDNNTAAIKLVSDSISGGDALV